MESKDTYINPIYGACRGYKHFSGSDIHLQWPRFGHRKTSMSPSHSIPKAGIERSWF